MGLQGTISPYIGNLSFLVALDLRNNSFRGTLTHEIGRLSRLKDLLLETNMMEGQIPPTIRHCQNLERLSLVDNSFSGVIPEELGTLPRLFFLGLGSNNFMGPIPSSLGNISTLQIFGLEQNLLTGSFPWTLFNITSLRFISLTNNSISGSLPMNICLLWPNLERLYLSFNHFRGQIPSSISQCRELRTLSLSTNYGFEGTIPRDIGKLQKLEDIYLGRNKITGTIPHSLGNISSLLLLAMENNYIQGEMPPELGQLSSLMALNFGDNQLTGVIPQQIFNISSLQSISLSMNSFHGYLPATIGFSLPNLELLYIGHNLLSGNIPTSLGNSSMLREIILSANLLTGAIPTTLGNLQLLEELIVSYNQLTREISSDELTFLIALTNCQFLQILDLGVNPIGGILPNSIGNFSSLLQAIEMPGCQIKGPIPAEIGSLKNMNRFDLSNNNVNGSIPSTIGGLESLQRLYLDGNKIEGLIPDEICHLHQLGELSLQGNNLLGQIPTCIGNLSHLQLLFLNSNNLSSAIPLSLWTLPNLLLLNLSSNSLGGYLPLEMRMSRVIESIDLSLNLIGGNISQTIGTFQGLRSLNLSRNSLQGPIPESFSGLISLEFMDLSYNNLSGTIPKSLKELSYLKYLNLSFNKLSGEIPDGGSFVNFTAQSFMENEGLCGLPILGVPACKIPNTQKTRAKQIFLKYILPASALIVISVAIMYMLIKGRGSRLQNPNSVELPTTMEHKMISFQELRQATNNFCDANLLGAGSYGSVYRGVLSDGETIAVKVLNLAFDRAFKSFDVECEVLRNVRHRNLVKVISTCSNSELRALVLQYMSNGSLDTWLYSQNYCLNLLQRVSIMYDVALALEYLHNDQSEPVVHCDLKPSNVLLDEEMVAHVGDFGIAKILVDDTAAQTKTLGTLGYIAPEYGSEGRVTTKCDIYSYGIMLLEMFTRKKPTDEMFTEDMSLRQWVNASLPDKVMEVVDAYLIEKQDGKDYMNVARACFLAIMELGKQCSSELPEERSDIKDVVIMLYRIKSQLLVNLPA
ncbi:LRR receptor-like serine/threonine-protein kinase EFR isoform X2 [Cornus florida]|nr:LRR receptor-like serine/threonine-protein kinase EFR isoform X2 [Cornus florida]